MKGYRNNIPGRKKKKISLGEGWKTQDESEYTWTFKPFGVESEL